jgi:hypothetical protein
MNEVAMLLGAMLFPVLGLGLLLWLTHLEETIPRDVRTAQREPPPPPILAVPVRTKPAPAPAAFIPEQRPAPDAALTGNEGALAT